MHCRSKLIINNLKISHLKLRRNSVHLLRGRRRTCGDLDGSLVVFSWWKCGEKHGENTMNNCKKTTWRSSESRISQHEKLHFTMKMENRTNQNCWTKGGFTIQNGGFRMVLLSKMRMVTIQTGDQWMSGELSMKSLGRLVLCAPQAHPCFHCESEGGLCPKLRSATDLTGLKTTWLLPNQLGYPLVI